MRSVGFFSLQIINKKIGDIFFISNKRFDTFTCAAFFV